MTKPQDPKKVEEDNATASNTFVANEAVANALEVADFADDVSYDESQVDWALKVLAAALRESEQREAALRDQMAKELAELSRANFEWSKNNAALKEQVKALEQRHQRMVRETLSDPKMKYDIVSLFGVPVEQYADFLGALTMMSPHDAAHEVLDSIAALKAELAEVYKGYKEEEAAKEKAEKERDAWRYRNDQAEKSLAKAKAEVERLLRLNAFVAQDIIETRAKADALSAQLAGMRKSAADLVDEAELQRENEQLTKDLAHYGNLDMCRDGHARVEYEPTDEWAHGQCPVCQLQRVVSQKDEALKRTRNRLMDFYSDIQNPKGVTANRLSKWMRKLAAEIEAALAALPASSEGKDKNDGR